ncbi:hypothetical protein M0802_001665 [Mischocyttarus mexicanus]|nr:hypothetical protein M0802_001665 [Mischocyttarus mexicanus]
MTFWEFIRAFILKTFIKDDNDDEMENEKEKEEEVKVEDGDWDEDEGEDGDRDRDGDGDGDGDGGEKVDEDDDYYDYYYDDDEEVVGTSRLKDQTPRKRNVTPCHDRTCDHLATACLLQTTVFRVGG